MPATGETGIKGPATGQTECPRAADRGILIVYMHIYMYIPLLQGQAKIVGAVQPGEEKAPG